MIALALLLGLQAETHAPEVRKLTSGPRHHFFGYIGHVRTIPWNEDESLIVGLSTAFQDHLPGPDEAADLVLLDAKADFAVRKIGETRAWNFQQGTMLYWNPRAPKTQFFYNDRAPDGRVFAGLFDVAAGKRVKEFKFDGVAVGNSGVAPDGRRFAAINYGRMARLRPVTGYPGAVDATSDVKHPENDGVFLVDVDAGTRTLLASFAALAAEIRKTEPQVDGSALFVNHTLWSRDGARLFFFVRGGWEGAPGEPKINASFVATLDGKLTRMKVHLGGHPEWDEGAVMIGRREKDQVLYDVVKQDYVGLIGMPGQFDDAEGDIALSPDGRWFVNGHRTKKDNNRYTFFKRPDGPALAGPTLKIGKWDSGPLRIDPAPCWNRKGDRILVTALDEDKTRQMFLIRRPGD